MDGLSLRGISGSFRSCEQSQAGTSQARSDRSPEVVETRDGANEEDTQKSGYKIGSAASAEGPTS